MTTSDERPVATDSVLLHQFIAQRSDKAFSELVERHNRMVYGTCLRSLGGNTAEAEDATQAVFIILAQKAETVKDYRNLGAWLFRTSRWVTMHMKRREERRRKHHELAAVEMERSGTMDKQDHKTETRSHLDEAIYLLGNKHKDAIVCHYLQGMSVRDTAKALNCAENTTKKRISAGLEKLRRFLARKGVVLSAAALLSLLQEELTLAAPVHLAQTATTAAIASLNAGNWASAGPGSLAKGAMEMVIWAKTKLIVGVAVSAIAVCGIVTPFVLKSMAGESGQERTGEEERKAKEPNKPAGTNKLETLQLDKNTTELRKGKYRMRFDRKKWSEDEKKAMIAMLNELAEEPIKAKTSPDNLPYLKTARALWLRNMHKLSQRREDSSDIVSLFIGTFPVSPFFGSSSGGDYQGFSLRTNTRASKSSEKSESKDTNDLAKYDNTPLSEKQSLSVVKKLMDALHLYYKYKSFPRDRRPASKIEACFIDNQTLMDDDCVIKEETIILPWQFFGNRESIFRSMKLHAWKWEDCSAEIAREINQNLYHLISEEAQRAGSWVVFSYTPNDLRHTMGKTENVYGIMFVVQKLNKAGKYQPLIRSAIPCKVKAKWLKNASAK